MPPRPIFPKKPTSASIKARQMLAIEWWEERLDTTGKITATKIINEESTGGVFRPGQFILFRYLAKHRNDKKKLPYWDRYPIAVILDVNKTGILSLNLHYLPLELRVVAFQKIQNLVKARHPNKNSRTNITYAVFRAISKLKICNNALKKHLFSHMKTRPARLTWDEMSEFAIYLDIEQWMVGNKSNGGIRKRVYADTRRKARTNPKKSKKPSKAVKKPVKRKRSTKKGTK